MKKTIGILVVSVFSILLISCGGSKKMIAKKYSFGIFKHREKSQR